MLVLGFAIGTLQANCYVAALGAGSEAVVVDPGESALDPVGRVLQEHRLRCVAVLLTHGHFDHCAAAAALADPGDLPVLLHQADEYMLDDPAAALTAPLRPLLAGYDLTGLRPSRVESLRVGGTLQLAGLDIEVDASPGHTAGSVIYRVEASEGHPRLLFTGDTLFRGSMGRTDLPGGSASAMRQSLARLAAHPDDSVVLPGHGPETTIGGERPWLDGSRLVD